MAPLRNVKSLLNKGIIVDNEITYKRGGRVCSFWKIADETRKRKV